MQLRDACAIVGIGNTAYTRGTDRSTLELHLEAATRAIADAGLSPGDIDGVMPHALADRTAEDFSANLDLGELAFSSTIHTGGASVGSAVQSACLAVAAGVATNVLVVAGRRGFSEQRVSTNSLRPMAFQAHIDEFERPYGSFVGMQWFAQAAQRHMHVYGTTSEQLGHVAVTQRAHANLNPQALMHHKPMTLEDHQASRIVVTPFHLLDCSLESDGAAAVVVTSTARARDLPHPPVLVAGFGEGHGRPPTSITQKPDMTVIEGLVQAGRRAYAMAGMGPSDVDCAQLADGFSFFVLACLEALGICAPGEAGPFVEEGGIRIGGRLPVNTHGGHLSEAHVSGMGHLVEAVRQLRRSVEPGRQVECETVLVGLEGNFHEGTALLLRR
jgi:acetyl-CoA acetyltransferase